MTEPFRRGIVLAGVVAAVVLLVQWTAQSRWGYVATPRRLAAPQQVDDIVARIDAHLADRCREADVAPVGLADELTVLRRLSLALHGTVPSLDELRQFEADTRPRPLARWTGRMLADDRFADYFAERLARSMVGTEDEPFLVYRRDRFTDWLSTQLKQNRPWDRIAREIISGTGLWTGHGETNFITATIADEQINSEELAGRTVRAFLGQRIDCAQCHDHPFADWKQSQFRGLTAFYGQTNFSVLGVEDKASMEYHGEDPATGESRVIPPSVPFGNEWLPARGTRRGQLAGWLTHADNRRFDRAIANRAWAMMFGRPYFSPVDDLPDPGDKDTRLLDLLADDFRSHGRDLRRLLHTIAAIRPFRQSSEAATDDPATLDQLEAHWAVFPLVRLRPEQVIGSLLQAGSIKTIDQNSHLLVRMIRFFRELNFVQEYGDLGEHELEDHTGTIPQALLRMNGQLPREIIEAGGFNASGRIASFAANDDATCLETCYLVCLARRPTPAESKHFLALLKGTQGQQRTREVEDLFWELTNSEEFSWNH